MPTSGKWSCISSTCLRRWLLCYLDFSCWLLEANAGEVILSNHNYLNGLVKNVSLYYPNDRLAVLYHMFRSAPHTTSFSLSPPGPTTVARRLFFFFLRSKFLIIITSWFQGFITLLISYHNVFSCNRRRKELVWIS